MGVLICATLPQTSSCTGELKKRSISFTFSFRLIANVLVRFPSTDFRLFYFESWSGQDKEKHERHLHLTFSAVKNDPWSLRTSLAWGNGSGETAGKNFLIWQFGYEWATLFCVRYRSVVVYRRGQDNISHIHLLSDKTARFSQLRLFVIGKQTLCAKN